MKTRVLIIDFGSRTHSVGGVPRVASVLYRDLKKDFDTYYLGYETSYLKPGKNTVMIGRSKPWLKPELKSSGLTENRFIRMGYFFLMGRNLLNIGMGREEILMHVKKIKPDIIISNSIWDFPILRYLKANLGFKTVYIDLASISNSNVSGYFSKEGLAVTLGTGLLSLSMESAKRKFFSFFDACVALNKAQLGLIRRYNKEAHYIPNGLDAGECPGEDAAERIRMASGIRNGDFVVLYLGRMFERQKNVSVLIKAFDLIYENNFKLLLVGNGQSLEYYKELASKDERVRFVGEVREDELPCFYEIADLFVIPSVWESFNLTMLEASAHRLPILFSENALIDDIKFTGAMTFNTLDPEDLRDKILLIAKDSAVRDDLAKASGRIAARFSKSNMLSGYTRLIRSIAGRP